MFDVFPVWLTALLALALWTPSVRAQYDPNWARNFRVGMLVGFNIKADFSMNGTFSLGGNGPGDVTDPNQDHFFDDGYVRVDDTGNALGYTTYFGYQNSSQLVGQTLQYHHTSSFTTDAGAVERNESPFVGLELAYGGNLWYWKRLRFGWEFGFGFLPIEMSDSRPLTADVVQTTYDFAIPNNVVIPSAPHDGGPSGAGQVLFPAAGLPVSTNNTSQTITGTRTLDVTLYTLRLGPSVFWDVNDYIGLSASIGPAVGFVTGDYRFNETVGTAINKGKFGVSDFVYGGYISATATYHATENGDFYLGVQFMPMSSASFSSGGRSAKLNLQGAAYVCAGVNWPF